MSNWVYRMFAILFCVLCMVWGHHTYAYVPEFVTQPTLHDITVITNPNLSQVYFGELVGMPHTYEIDARESFTLSLELRTPQAASNTRTVSAIVIKVPRKGRVEEVTRLLGTQAQWDERRDPLSGDTYLTGSSFVQELGPGLYRIEVHTPDNAEKYMLQVGTIEDMTISYFELISRLFAIKDFYGTSRFFVVYSPYVYVPLIVLVFGASVVWYVRRKHFLS